MTTTSDMEPPCADGGIRSGYRPAWPGQADPAVWPAPVRPAEIAKLILLAALLPLCWRGVSRSR